jgi:hypothetical protein
VTTGEVGTTCKIRYRIEGGDPDADPVEGDLLRTVPGGTCYRIDTVRRLPDDARWPGARRFTLKCIRLGKDAVQLGEPGVYGLVWDSRRAGGRRGRQGRR